MDIYGQIAQKVKQIVGGSEAIIFPAEVKSVDDTTCTILIGDLQLSDVRLRAVINDEEDKLLITPAVGSQVLVADLSNGQFRDLAVLTYSEPEKIDVKIGETAISVKDGLVEFNGGGNNGLVNISDLTQKLNNFENKVNELITVLSGISVTLAPSGTFPFAPFFSTVQTLTPTQQSDIEDTKVTH